MQRQYNLRNPAVKRLMKEAQELREPTEQYHAQPLDDNLFEWHFTIRGPADSEFEAGLYHGRIILPPEYPMKPPSIILLTPNGRFETNKKICLSISGYHPESWQPCWSIRTALLAIIGFMPTHGAGAIGSLDYSAPERKTLAKRSQGWKCSDCGNISSVLAEVTKASEETNKKAKELASQISFQAEKEKRNSVSGAATTDTPASQSSGNPIPENATSSVPNTPITGEAQNVNPTPPPIFPPMSPFGPAFNVPMWQPSATSTADSKFGPTFPLPFVAPTFPPGFPPQYFMPGSPFYNPGVAPSPYVQANPDMSHGQSGSSFTGSTPTTSTSSNSQVNESITPLPETGSTAPSPRIGSTSPSTPTEGTASSPTTGGTNPTTITDDTTPSPTTGSTTPVTSNNTTTQSTTTMSQTTSTTATNSVRQRLPQSNQPNLSATTVHVRSSPPQTADNKTLSLLFILLLSLAILLLVIRRVLMF